MSLARERMQTWCDSGADSKVWMKEDKDFNMYYSFPEVIYLRDFLYMALYLRSTAFILCGYIDSRKAEVVLMKIGVRKMVVLAVLAALSVVLMQFIRFPIIPAAPYLIYEPADIPMLIGSFVYGPISGFLITIVVSAIQATLFSTDGIVGFVMHVIASGTFVIVSGLIYKRFHSLKGAIAALVVGTICRALVMIPTNLIIQTNFYGQPYDLVKSMIVPAIIPFNLLVAGINSVVTIIVYKSISKVIGKFGGKTAA